jgi:glycine/D-amino acid oxidase-like deaminating enzyme
VFKQSRVVDWDPRHVVTDDGSIAAKAVVMATHLPLGQIGGFYAVAHPRAEPMVVAPIGRVPNGMYISAEQPSHSIRTRKQNGEVFGIVASPSSSQATRKRSASPSRKSSAG